LCAVSRSIRPIGCAHKTRSRIPRWPLFNWSGEALDILIGVTALPLAVWVSFGSLLAVLAAIGWSALGLFDFALAMVLARFGTGRATCFCWKRPGQSP
jgi:hypothetical protein